MNKGKISYRKIVSSILVLCFSGALSAEASASDVIERMGRAESTPEWTYGGAVMWKEKDKVIFSYALEMSGDSRSDICMKAASLQARAEMRRYISESISSSELLSQANLTSDPEFESVTASLAQGKITGASTKEQYWEKLLTKNARGEERIRMRCASQISVDQRDLNEQLNKTIEVATPNNPKVRRALMHAQTNFIGDLQRY
jgi:hypothetical protein